MYSTIIIHIISAFIEATVLWYFLRSSFGKALLMSVTANIISSVVISVVGILSFMYTWKAWEPGEKTLVEVILFSSWHVTFILMQVFAIAIELGTIKVFWKYKWQQLWLPVIAMNILSYLILAILSLTYNWIW